VKEILAIWKKELRDNIRDRRTLLSSIVMPMLLMPLIIIGMGKLVQYQVKQANEQPVKIGIVNESAAPDFVNQLKAINKTDVISLNSDPSLAAKERQVDLAVALPTTMNGALDQLQPVVIETYQNSLNSKSSTAFARVNAVATLYNQSLLHARLAQNGINANIQNGIQLKLNESATPQELGGFGLGFLLPLFIVMWSVIGGQYMAVDVSAGEKERKTLEALILTPVRRMNVVFGKFFAVATAALMSVIIALTSLYLVFVFGGADLFTGVSTTSAAPGSAASSFNFNLQPQAILLMLGVSVLLVLLFSAMNLSVAIFAKSYKEAQSYIGPSYLVVILPVVLVNTLPGFIPTAGFFAIPVVNAVLLFKEVLIGQFVLSHILLTLASLIIVALAAVYISSRIYRKESVLFRD
jgi:sodium transport system permease protein